jgi:putative membrane protein
MRQLNFIVLFAIALLLVLFALENTDPVSVQITPGNSVSAPLAVELIVAMGIGAVIAWFFSVWSNMQKVIEMQPTTEKIQNMEQELTEMTMILRDQKQLGAAIDVEVEEEKDKAS